MKKTNIIPMIFILLINLVACSMRSPNAQVSLENKTWLLISYNGQSLIESSQITLKIDAGQISGNAGCNHYGGSFKVDGQAVHFDDIYATEMFCAAPPGIMDQEQSYLAALGSVDQSAVTGGQLILTMPAQHTLVFEQLQVSRTPVPEPTIPASPTAIVNDTNSTPSLVNEPSPGSIEYQDPDAGISITVPDSWMVTGIVVGQHAVLQSFPANKYIGGEALDQGDAKCDLSIQPAGVTLAGYIDQLKSSPMLTVESEHEMTLQSGGKGMRFEIDNLGRSVLYVTQLNQRTIVLNCFGDLSITDEIASSLTPSK